MLVNLFTSIMYFVLYFSNPGTITHPKFDLNTLEELMSQDLPLPSTSKREAKERGEGRGARVGEAVVGRGKGW